MPLLRTARQLAQSAIAATPVTAATVRGQDLGIIAELAARGLITLGDKGYLGEDTIRTARGRCGWRSCAGAAGSVRAHGSSG
jgi:hypothetical protein